MFLLVIKIVFFFHHQGVSPTEYCKINRFFLAAVAAVAAAAVAAAAAAEC